MASPFPTTGGVVYLAAAPGLFPVPITVAYGRAEGQTGAKASLATYTVGPSDGSFEVTGNVLVTVATNHTFSLVFDYTDEGNTARTLTVTFWRTAGGSTASTVTNANGAVPYHGFPYAIRCKAATTITASTSGTFTTVTYNVEAIIRQIA